MSEQDEPMNLPIVDCCATCTWMRDRAYSAWCEKHRIGVLPYTKCDTFERRPGMPVWIICEKVQAK